MLQIEDGMPVCVQSHQKDAFVGTMVYIRVFLKKKTNLIFYRATLSFGVFGVKNTTHKILSILMHI